MEYKIVYSNRRTVSLMIKDGGLVVRAPKGASKKKIEQIVLSHSDWVNRSLEKWKQRNEKILNLTDEDIKKLRQRAKDVIPLKVKKYSEIMNIKYGRITITSAKTRFGSCSSKGNIAFSYRVMLYPEEAIDYVVVHELAHILEMNHSAKFYKIIQAVMPDYRERHKLLKN